MSLIQPFYYPLGGPSFSSLKGSRKGKNMSDTGWIKIHRDILKWEWYDDVNTLKLFLHLLITANHEDRKWKGIVIKRGQRLCGLHQLAKETTLSVQVIRTCIKRLKSTSELTSKSFNKGTVITITNYDEYQAANKPSNKQLTNKQQTTNKQLTTTKEYKNYKNEKNDKNIFASDEVPVESSNDEFEEFWKVYPRKVNKAGSKKDFSKVLKTGTLNFDTLLELTKRFALECSTSGTEAKFIPHASTWLNQSRWEDIKSISATGTTPEVARDDEYVSLKQLMDQKREQGWSNVQVLTIKQAWQEREYGRVQQITGVRAENIIGYASREKYLHQLSVLQSGQEETKQEQQMHGSKD